MVIYIWHALYSTLVLDTSIKNWIWISFFCECVHALTFNLFAVSPDHVLRFAGAALLNLMVWKPQHWQIINDYLANNHHLINV
jgi:hypothetical protein